MRKKYKLVILDRDGVINQDSNEYIKSPDEWHAIPGSLEAIAKLNKASVKVVIATNQSGVARGLFTIKTLHKIHQKMQNELAKIGGHIDDIFYCPHHPDDNCLCRKPQPKMLLDILQKYSKGNKLVAPTLFIGDSFKDIETARKVGCDAFLVKTGKGNKTLKEHNNELKDVAIYKDLLQAVTSFVP
jgi:D-glycero-D-manno-heptose 1,7-bisphosphate phosphatase